MHGVQYHWYSCDLFAWFWPLDGEVMVGGKVVIDGKAALSHMPTAAMCKCGLHLGSQIQTNIDAIASCLWEHYLNWLFVFGNYCSQNSIVFGQSLLM